MKLSSFSFGLKKPEERRKIGQAEIQSAMELLKEYKSAKSALEARIVEDEQWWKLRNASIKNENERAAVRGFLTLL